MAKGGGLSSLALMSELILNCSAIESVSGLPCKEPGKPSESLCDHNRSEAWAGPPWEHQQLSGWQQCKHSPAAAPLQSPKNTHGKFMALTELLGVTQKQGLEFRVPCEILWLLDTYLTEIMVPVLPVTAESKWRHPGFVSRTVEKHLEQEKLYKELFEAIFGCSSIILGHDLLQAPKPCTTLRAPHLLDNSPSPVHPMTDFAFFLSENHLTTNSNWHMRWVHSSVQQLILAGVT